MKPPDTVISPQLLSPRERSVVELAVEGKTDEQIAQGLDLSTSTVNSYWVRIRGKVGHLSRTEIVAGVLRHQWSERCTALEAQHEALLTEARPMREAYARAEVALETAGGASWTFLALERLPVAVIVARSPGVVTYANREAVRLLEMEATELTGRSVWELSVEENGSSGEASIRQFFADPAVRALNVGVEKAHYIRRGDGSNFRATFIAETFDAPDGPMAVLTFRPYLDEIETLVQAIGRPFASE